MPNGLIPPDDEDLQIVTDIYFRMMESYKAVRLRKDHFTLYPKNAAIVTMAVMATRPFRGTKNDELIFTNPMFGISAGLAKLELNTDAIPDGSIKRVCLWLDSLIFSSADAVIKQLCDARLVGQPFGHHDFKLQLSSQDICNIGMLVSYFELWQSYETKERSS